MPAAYPMLKMMESEDVCARMKNRVLVLGGTGALGSYLVPELLRLGHRVDVVSLDRVSSNNPDLSFETADAKNLDFLRRVLSKDYDAVVDFMGYSTAEFAQRCALFLHNTRQYMFLSSYRVYAGVDAPIREDTPRLLDVSTDAEFLASDDYALEKARQEDLLQASGQTNWTILRPAITFSSRKFQLTTMEANSFVCRALDGKTVVLPEIAMEKQATLNWSGDTGKMMARLVLNPAALGQCYTVSTAEHHTWREFAEYYRELLGMKYITADTESFLEIFDQGSLFGRWRLMYDRAFHRVVDNRKILRDTGLRQEDLMPVKNALRMELSGLPKDDRWCRTDIANLRYEAINARMDAYLSKIEQEHQ